jgi:hypothetical protein
LRDRPTDIAAKVGRHVVSAGYFATMTIPLLRGRTFTPADRLGGRKVALVSVSAARMLWPGDDPIGKPIALGLDGFGDRVEVVGVVISAVRREVGAVDPLAPIYEMATMKERVRTATLPATFSTIVLGILAGMALPMAAVGGYGVQRRTRPSPQP